MSKNLDVVKTWFRRVWTEEDETAIDEMLVPETEAMGLASKTLIGPEGFKAFHRSFLANLSDFDIQIDRYLEDGEWASVLVTLNAKRRDNGADVKTTGNVYLKIIDGKLVQGANHFDFIGLLEQLDKLPERTFERCLAGEKFR